MDRNSKTVTQGRWLVRSRKLQLTASSVLEKNRPAASVFRLNAGEATCSRCGQPCDRGPWRAQLCNRCALELGAAEVAERQAVDQVPPGPSADVCGRGLP
jgi:hypothetical protein